MSFTILLVIIAISSARGAEKSIIAFDCAQQYNNISTFSLIDIGECHVAMNPKVYVEKTKIALVQLNDYAKVHVKLCKVEVTREVAHCDAAWYKRTRITGVEGGKISYIEHVTRLQCDTMHNTLNFHFRNQILIPNLMPNNSRSMPVQLAGHRGDKGASCMNGYYSDPYGTWSEVIVDGWIKVTIEDYEATVDIDNNQVILNTGVKCKLNSEQCIDLYGGHAFWDAAPKDRCKDKYSKLYVGSVDKITDPENPDHPVFALESSIMFAFTAKSKFSACSNEFIRTDDPRIFIAEMENPEYLEVQESLSPENIDLMAYMNSKFLYVEKHYKIQLKNLYHDVLLQKCNLEKKIIANALSLALLDPANFAYQVVGGPGFIGLVAGESVNIIQCISVPVKYRRTTKCYQELPVYKDEEEYFMAPRTHILTKTGTSVECNSLVPSMFFLGEMWFKFAPEISEAKRPQVLQPGTQASWKYVDPKNLAEAGIYTPEQLKSLKEYMRFPLERSAVLNSVARGMMGHNITGEKINPSFLFDAESIRKIIQSTWEQLWGKFMSFGTASAGILGLIMVARLIKFCADTAIHTITLYNIYGISLHLLGAVWDSVTQLLIHLGQDVQNRREQVNTQETEPIEEIEPTAPTFQAEINHVTPMYPLLGLTIGEQGNNQERERDRRNLN